jgi:hypothetical protein
MRKITIDRSSETLFTHRLLSESKQQPCHHQKMTNQLLVMMMGNTLALRPWDWEAEVEPIQRNNGAIQVTRGVKFTIGGVMVVGDRVTLVNNRVIQVNILIMNFFKNKSIRFIRHAMSSIVFNRNEMI